MCADFDGVIARDFEELRSKKLLMYFYISSILIKEIFIHKHTTYSNMRMSQS